MERRKKCINPTAGDADLWIEIWEDMHSLASEDIMVEEGVTLADSVETLGVDLRTKVTRRGAIEKARRKKCNVRFSLIQKNEAFQRSA